jgi:hypothetical protein
MKGLVRQIAVIISFCIMFAAVVQAIPPARAVTLPNHVVINEFEQFAVGGDYNKQWVEIYNPTSAPMAIGNWKIVTFFGTTRTIPSDTIVPANGYYVFMLTGIVLIHNNEVITLKDASNNVVDMTAKKSKTTASSSTWQRYPNGVDTNSDGDWQFRPATKWRSNGGETVSISISSSSITFGSDVTLSGTINPGHLTFVRIQASTDSGATWLNVTIVASSVSGGYSYVVVFPDVGFYLFRSVLPWDSGVVSGTVSLTVNKISSEINVFAPNTVIRHESASLTGFISPIKSGVTVTFTIGMPNGTYITRSATTNSAGYFNFTFAPDAEGIWNVTAGWSGDSRTLGATSSIAFFKVEPAEIGAFIVPLLLIVPVIAIVAIVLGLTLGRTERKAVLSPTGRVTRLPPPMPRRMFPWRSRVLPARVCPGCGAPLIYSSQYRRWFCSRCRRYI